MTPSTDPGASERPQCRPPGDQGGTEPRHPRRDGWRRGGAVLVTVGLVLGLLTGSWATRAQAATTAPVGQGFTITPGDLAFILRQIKVAERHSRTLTPQNPCGTLVGPDRDQVPDRLTPYGLRTVDGSCNNLHAGRERMAAADLSFPRTTNPRFRDAEPSPPGFFGPGGPTVTSSSYAQVRGPVFDSGPRLVSTLVHDQTSANHAAVAAARFPVRSQSDPGLFPCTTDPDPLAIPPVEGVPAGCVPSHTTLFIPNVTTDVGLSPPYNSVFTFFGQFFDHGVDQTVKGKDAVFVPLRADDPLVAGRDHRLGTVDDLPVAQRFMVLNRALNQPGPDGVLGDDPATPSDESADDLHEATNTDTPWVDQSQTYTSHASHQVFLREYVATANRRPVPTGRLLGGLGPDETYPGSPDGRSGMSTWAAVKKQSSELLGLDLHDADVLDVPMVAVDPYGNFQPGPKGLPQYVTRSGMVEGDLVSPVPVPADVLHFATPFLTDIAHHADPSPRDTDRDPSTPPVAPVPDADAVPSHDGSGQVPGTYDDEMLDAHFACGDGRCNENIALSAIHQVFHSEHDRVVDDIRRVLTSDVSPSGVAALTEWRSSAGTPDGWNGARLFQAARFVTEMEYQHLVFEEFARKIQPALRPFTVYSPDVDATVDAEFAHAVYRFGHSMLNDTVARRNLDGSDNSLPLLTAFLDPTVYQDGGSAGTITPEQAAGTILMGSSDQVGNELDEFVTDTLRNNLLGLPLDLATLNIARGRETGMPTLNELRRQLHGTTNDGQLVPYTSWSDFGQHLKHAESLVNLVAAYGRHPSITSTTTVTDKRIAARAIVDPLPTDDPPTDAAEFMFGTGTWADAADGATTTGLDDVDLWTGGLAESTSVNGGLLGTTFNAVFEDTLSDLQDGDRFYYLARLPGLNLRAQIEGNSFAEIIRRTTQGTAALKSDVFSTADCRFDLSRLDGTATAFTTKGSITIDDPASPDCDESKLLMRKPDGTIAYRVANTVDPTGLNGQAVYQGTAGTDRVEGGVDNDTLWGDDGADVLNGSTGDDAVLGGEGDDRITDAGGDDVLKGGPGDDVIDAGPGLDLVLGGDGRDVVNGGANDNETFGGPGDDFLVGGQGADAVFGDGGDDWIQGGTGQDLLIGDHGAPFFDDPGESAPGNDVLIGQAGENDYDAEGGDDLMAQNAGVDRNAGAGGFDWAIHQYDTEAADDDLEINNNLAGLPVQAVVNRDRWQEVEAVSGSSFDDVIKGTSIAPLTVGGAGFSGCDVLDRLGIARISGLADIVPEPSSDPAPVAAASAAGACPTSGTVWGDGDVLVGGPGNDTITGRGADDIIDGDRDLRMRISVRTDPADPTTEIGTTDLLEGRYLRDATGNLTGSTLQAALFAGTVRPRQLVVVRELADRVADAADCVAAAPTNCDTAVFAGPLSNYTITSVVRPGGADDAVLVTQIGASVAGQRVSDGSDTVRNVERLRFSDATVSLPTTVGPTTVTATLRAGIGALATVDVRWTTPTSSSVTASGSEVLVLDGTTVVRTVEVTTGTMIAIGSLPVGRSYVFRVRVRGAAGAGPLSAPSDAVLAVNSPSAPTSVTAVRGDASATVGWSAPASDGGSAVTGYLVEVLTGTTVLRTVTVGPATSLRVTALSNGTRHRFRVTAVNEVGPGARSTASAVVTPATTPSSPVLGAVLPGARGGARTASVAWTAPALTGGSAITGYRVEALPVDAAGSVTGPSVVVTTGAAARKSQLTLTAGLWRFRVSAVNALGTGAPSALSAPVAPA